MALLQELLKKPPAEVASWAIDQAQELSKEGAQVEHSALFQLAGALGNAPVEQKQELVRNAMSGIEQLPARKKVEAMRLGMQAANMAQQAGVAVPGMPAPATGAGAQSSSAGHRAVPEGNDLSKPLLAGGRGGSTGGGAVSSSQALAAPPPLIANLMRVGEQAKFHEMPQAEVQALTQEVQVDVSKLISPKQLVEVVQELKPEEREELTTQLVEAKMIPQEHAATVQEALKPGGYADQLVAVFNAIESVHEHALGIIGPPIVEFLVSLFLGLFSCDVGLQGWVRFSALQWLGMCGCAYAIGRLLQPAYEPLKSDPVGVVQRWSQAPDGFNSEDDYEQKCKEAFPDLPWMNVKIACGFLIGFALCLAMSVLWVVIGIFEFLGVFLCLFDCNGFVVLVALIFLALHVCLLLYASMMVKPLVETVLSALQHRESSQIPMSSDALPLAAPDNRA